MQTFLIGVCTHLRYCVMFFVKREEDGFFCTDSMFYVCFKANTCRERAEILRKMRRDVKCLNDPTFARP